MSIWINLLIAYFLIGFGAGLLVLVISFMDFIRNSIKISINDIYVFLIGFIGWPLLLAICFSKKLRKALNSGVNE